MPHLADLLLFTAALGAGVYCHILARRLRRLSRLDTGLGAAVMALSVQVDAMVAALGAAREGTGAEARALAQSGVRAEAAARRLELLIAALHDLPLDPEGRLAPEGRNENLAPQGRNENLARQERNERDIPGGREAADVPQPRGRGNAPKGWQGGETIAARSENARPAPGLTGAPIGTCRGATAPPDEATAAPAMQQRATSGPEGADSLPAFLRRTQPERSPA